jgi:hypothetical protein
MDRIRRVAQVALPTLKLDYQPYPRLPAPKPLPDLIPVGQRAFFLRWWRRG